MCLMTYFFAITKDLVVVFKNVFQKLSISKTDRSSSEIWDCQWHETFSVNTSLYRLDLLLFFQIIKVLQCNFTNFLFFLTVTNALSTSWVNFSNTGMIVCFSYFLMWFSHGSLMKTNYTCVFQKQNNVMFRWWKTES